MKTKFQVGDLVKAVGFPITQRVGVVVATVADGHGFKILWNPNKQFDTRLSWVKEYQVMRAY